MLQLYSELLHQLQNIMNQTQITLKILVHLLIQYLLTLKISFLILPQ